MAAIVHHATECLLEQAGGLQLGDTGPRCQNAFADQLGDLIGRKTA
jgi:hypothetical protein